MVPDENDPCARDPIAAWELSTNPPSCATKDDSLLKADWTWPLATLRPIVPVDSIFSAVVEPEYADP